MSDESAVSRGLIGRRAIVTAAVAAPFHRWSVRAQSPEAVRFGLTPVVLDSDERFHALLRAVLEAGLGRPVELVQRRSYQEITTLLLSGQLHAAWICGYPFVQYADRLRILAVPVYRGQALYQSYLIARQQIGAVSLEDLRGHVHAFSDPDSNSGHLVTRYLLARLGETPASFFRESFFTYGHRNTIRAVASGLAQSGSVEGYVWDVLSEMEPRLIESCAIVSRSEWLGFPPVAALSTRVEDPSIRSIGTILTSLGENAQGRELLDLLRLDGFVERGPEHFAGIARISRFVELHS